MRTPSLELVMIKCAVKKQQTVNRVARKLNRRSFRVRPASENALSEGVLVAGTASIVCIYVAIRI